MITFDSVTLGYPGAEPVLRDVSFSISEGEWLTVAGANGAGKTTLLKAIAGLIAPSAGRIDRPQPPPAMAMLLQNPDDQLVAASVRDELLLSSRPGDSDKTRFQTLDEVVERFALGPLLDRNPHEVSGGEKQRVALATVWLQSPAVLLLDEATAAQDHGMTGRCVDFVRDLHAAGTTIVWSTTGIDLDAMPGDVVCLHDAAIAFRGDAAGAFLWSDRAGVALARPPLRELAERAGNGAWSSEEIGTAAASVDALAGRLMQEPEWTATGAAGTHTTKKGPEASRVHASAQAKSVVAQENPAVAFDGVEFSYGDTRVFERLDVSVSMGSVVGISGSNASGKTTLLLLAGGAHAPDRGRVARHGAENVFYLPQSPEQLLFAETVTEEVAFGLRRRGMKRTEAHRRAATALALCDLDPEVFGPRPPLQLSRGEMRRLSFAIAAALAPDLLLLDEPTANLDAAGRQALERVLDECRERDATVLMASHHGDRLMEWCDRVVCLDAGGVVADLRLEGSHPDEIDWPPPVPVRLQLERVLASHGRTLPATLARRAAR